MDTAAARWRTRPPRNQRGKTIFRFGVEVAAFRPTFGARAGNGLMGISEPDLPILNVREFLSRLESL